MAESFEGFEACDDSDFLTIRYRDIVAENHPIRFIDRFIETIDVECFEKKYRVGEGQKGRSPKAVRLMLKVILYAIYCRIYSARKIDYATEHYADFWFFSYARRISHDKISDFIRLHGEDLHTVFLETISLARDNDLLSFDALYQDGFKVKATASKKRNYTQHSFDKKQEQLSENVSHVLEALQSNAKNPHLVEESKKVQGKLLQIGTLRDELLKRIAKRSEGKSAAQQKEIVAKTLINATDPDAELMRQKDGSHANAYLKVVGTDNKADIVISSTISGHDYEAQTSLPLFEQANMNLTQIGSTQTYSSAVADSSFITMENCTSYESKKAQIIGPTQEYEHSKRNPEKQKEAITFQYDESTQTVRCSEGAVLSKTGNRYRKERDIDVDMYSNKEACKNCACLHTCTESKKGYRIVLIDPRLAAQQRSIERYRSEKGQILYKKRCHVAETYQGDLKKNGRFISYLLRGIAQVRIESMLHDIVWNLQRIFTETSTQSIVWNT